MAIFYGVKSIRLREQVKRNIKRFPSDFMFQLTEKEALSMVSQNAIPSKQHMGETLPFVFTEQEVINEFKRDHSFTSPGGLVEDRKLCL